MRAVILSRPFYLLGAVTRVLSFVAAAKYKTTGVKVTPVNSIGYIKVKNKPQY